MAGERRKRSAVERRKRSSQDSIAPFTLQSLIFSISVSFCLWARTCLGFLPKHYAVAFTTFVRPKAPLPLSIQGLYKSDLDIINQTDSFVYADGIPRRASSTSTGTSTSTQSKSNPDRSASKPKYDLKLLLIDHYDSFTYNLYDMLAQLCETPPIVLAKDAFQDWSDIVDANTFDGVILSPGPGTPTHPDDIGTLSPSIIQQNPNLPILGVCLGHQIMGHVYGAQVDLCGPVHGQVRPVERDTSDRDLLWNDIPETFYVTRYHSLAVTLPDDSPLRPAAYTADDEGRILMGMSHQDYPHYGVQFHPESIGSEYGHQLLQNFCEICQTTRKRNQTNSNGGAVEPKRSPPRPHGHDRETHEHTSVVAEPVSETNNNNKYKVFVHKVADTDLSPLEVFEEFLSHEQYSVWLDTSRGVQSAAHSESSPAYSSIMGAGNSIIEYFGKEQSTEHQGLFHRDVKNGQKVQLPHDNILEFLQEQHAHATDHITVVSFDGENIATPDDGRSLPFDFRGGRVGYLGYEVRHDSEKFLAEEEHGSREKWKPSEHSLLSPPPPKERAEPVGRVPTAAFLFLDKSWVYDHASEDWYLITVVDVGESGKENTESALEWMESTGLIMKGLKMRNCRADGIEKSQESGFDHQRESVDSPSVKFIPNRPRDCYNQNFADCQEQIRLGESYELCLTNQLEADVKLSAGRSPFDLYKILRRRNPAPFSAFLNLNAAGYRGKDTTEDTPSLAICCSSPERFVSVKRKQADNGDRGVNGFRDSAQVMLQVEAKPIKGTCARVIPQDQSAGLSASEIAEDERRALELKASVKNRAENLMIVDLLRNDLSRVCEVGSVHVSKLMDIESYATVHQMVSTIRGTLDPAKANAVDILKATFPGGSMTGAPKIRTMEILERLEEGVSRGPYSGCLGYISVNGSMDMNIVIRSAVLTPKAGTNVDGDDECEWKVSIGAGGAITALSESTDEYEEMILKASAVIRAVEEWADPSQSEPSPVAAGAKNAMSSPQEHSR